MITRVASLVAALVLAATLLASLLERPHRLRHERRVVLSGAATASQAVAGHGHLEGVRKYTLNGLRNVAPRLYDRLAKDVSKKQGVCIAGYTGHFTAAEVTKAMGRPSGTLAVVVVTTPGNELLGTLVLTKIPVRFQHTHLF